MPPRLIALGDLFLDVVVVPERPIERGTDVPGTVAFRRGGSAANTAAAFADLGGSASLITCLGDDAWASRLVRSLRSDGARVHAVRRAAPTGRLAALIDERGERSFVTQRGAADLLRAEDLDMAWFRGLDVLHVPAYSLLTEPIGGASAHAATLAHEAGGIVSCDLSSQGPLLAFGVRRSRARIAALGPDILFASRDEAGALLNRPGRRAWPGLLRLAPLVVVKDGPTGCRVLWRGEEPDSQLQLDVATQRIGRVDSTGAGDAFAAGFLFSMLEAGRPTGLLADGLARAPALRRAALAGHRAATKALRRGRAEIRLG